jgi:hypothetical protein
MDIEKGKRMELISHLGDSFNCVEECQINLIGFDEVLRADVIAFSQIETEPWTLAFEVKEPTGKWEFKNWTKAMRQAGNYPNCIVSDERAGLANGNLINASFLYPGPDMVPWMDPDSQNTRFYRNYDLEPLRGAVLLAQHFKVGTVNYDNKNGRLSLKLGTDPVWDSRLGFRKKSAGLLAKRRIGSSKRLVENNSVE